jgi:phage baseplate assembly protein W
MGLTGKIHSDVTGSYTRSRAARTAITMATLASASAAWSSGGFILVDDTNCPGLYRFDVPDAAFATGAGVDRVIVSVKVTGAIEEHIEFLLTDWNKQVASIPNAAAEAAGGLFTRGTGAGQINQAANGMIDTNPVRLNNVAQSLLDLKDFADEGYDPATNKVEGVKLADTVTTYTGNTPQTGDAFARLGAPAGASVSADIAAIEAQTDDIGAAGAGLTAVPWNAAWDAEVQSEVADALNAYDPPTKAELDSGLAGLNDLTAVEVENAVWDAVLADHLDAGSTGAGLNAAGSAGDPWTTALPGAYGAGSAGAILASRSSQASVDAVDDLVDTEVASIQTTLGSPAGASLAADIAAIEAQTDDIGAAGAGLTAVPWNPAWDAEVQSEATDALNAYDPPTKAELDSGLGTADDATLAALVTLTALVDDLESRLSAARALLLDNLANLTAAPPTAVVIADTVLDRNMATGTDSGSSTVRTVRNALRPGRNRVHVDSVTGVITVYKEDDTTVAWTAQGTATAGMDPLTEINPAG